MKQTIIRTATALYALLERPEGTVLVIAKVNGQTYKREFKSYAFVYEQLKAQGILNEPAA